MIDESKGLECGGYTHEIIYLDGPKFDSDIEPSNADLSSYLLTELSQT